MSRNYKTLNLGKMKKSNLSAMLFIIAGTALFSCKKDNQMLVTKPVTSIRPIEGATSIVTDNISKLATLTPVNGQMATYLTDDAHSVSFPFDFDLKSLDVNGVYINADVVSSEMIDRFMQTEIYKNIEKTGTSILIDANVNGDNKNVKRICEKLGFGTLDNVFSVVVRKSEDGSAESIPLYDIKKVNGNLTNSLFNTKGFYYEPTTYTLQEEEIQLAEYNEAMACLDKFNPVQRLPETATARIKRTYEKDNISWFDANKWKDNDFLDYPYDNQNNCIDVFTCGDACWPYYKIPTYNLRGQTKRLTTAHGTLTKTRQALHGNIGERGIPVSISSGTQTTRGWAFTASMGGKYLLNTPLGFLGGKLTELIPVVQYQWQASTTNTVAATQTGTAVAPYNYGQMASYINKPANSCKYVTLCNDVTLYGAQKCGGLIVHYFKWNMPTSQSEIWNKGYSITTKESGVFANQVYIHGVYYGLHQWR